MMHATFLSLLPLVLSLAQASPRSPAVRTDRDLLEVFRNHGFHAAAKAAGGHFGYSDHPQRGPVNRDLENLTRGSDLIVVGIPREYSCKVTDLGGEETITTNYWALVRETIKGADVARGDTIEVALLGGRVVFEDGTSAEISTPDFERMEDGRTYALLLGESGLGAGVYGIVGGAQGLFELPTDGSGIAPHGRPIDEVMKLRGTGVEKFLEDVRKMAEFTNRVPRAPAGP